MVTRLLRRLLARRRPRALSDAEVAASLRPRVGIDRMPVARRCPEPSTKDTR